MPSSRTLIASNTLGSNASSVTFSSIPSTYKDLVLRLSARTTASSTINLVVITPNGTPSASFIRLRGSGSSASSSSSTGESTWYTGLVSGNTATANTFGSIEVYIPNYASVANRVYSTFAVQENNNAVAYIDNYAGLDSQTAALSSFTIYDGTFSTNFVAGSSFFLYGLKNS